MKRIGLIFSICTLALAQQPPETATFRSGTRLVQVDVVVRDKNGPVKGLTKESFALFDQGKQQQIAVFHEASVPPERAPGPLPAGAISNRFDNRGKPLENATVLLLDQLNTVQDNSVYSRSWALKYLQSLRTNERIAVYMLGSKLGVVQDFTDDPEKLARAVTKWDPKAGPVGVHWMDNPMSGTTGPGGTGESIDLYMERVTAPQYAAMRRQMTADAIAGIARHMSGVPGRRNLVWLAEKPQLDAATLAPLRASDIALYPVLVRGAPDAPILQHNPQGRGGFIDHNVMGVLDPHRDETLSTRDRALQAVAASTGGVAFTDSRDIGLAMRRAEEDAIAGYTLGYYPAEDALDGKLHALKVVVSGTNAFELRYRSGYVASRTSATPQSFLPGNPLNATGIRLTAVVSPDSLHPGKYKVNLTVDLHDVHMARSGAIWTGAIDLGFLDPLSGADRTTHLRIQFPEERFAAALDQGFPINLDGLAFEGPEVVVVVTDKATGLTGSLRLHLKDNPTKDR